MNNARNLARCAAAGVGALVLVGGGIAAASTVPSEPPGDTTAASAAPTDAATMETASMDTTMSMDTAAGGSEPMAGGGPSDCPTIPAAAEAPATSAAAEGTAAAETMATTAETEMATASAPAASAAPAETTGDSMAPTGSMAAASGPFVQVAESEEYGPILVDSQCRALYAFTQDADGESTCVDDCAVNWPPLFVTDGAVPPVADELDPSHFSVVEHPEGAMLKVGDWPLYYFAGDVAPGDTNGQAVGDVWWLVSTDGTLIGAAAGSETSAPTADSAAPAASAPAESAPAETAPATTGA